MLTIEDEQTFIDALLADQPEPPKYFAMMKKLNKEGPAVLGTPKAPHQLTADQLGSALDQGVVLDLRSAKAFSEGHIPGTINIPAGGSFTNWAGWFLSYDKPFYFIGDERLVEESYNDLIAIGLDQLAGYFDESVFADRNDLQRYHMTNADELADAIANHEVTLVDVRNQTEWNEGHIPEATHIMLGYLPERIAEVPVQNGHPVVVQCRSGARSAIAASILQANGIINVVNMSGGINLWKAKQLPTVS